jgi:hypothetical protein
MAMRKHARSHERVFMTQQTWQSHHNKMPGYCAVILFFAVAVGVATATSLVAPSADTLCGNGAVCSASETCVSHVKNAGHKYACSPFSNAVVCGDSRFSCPENFICNYSHHSCDSSNGNIAMPFNKNGHIVTGTMKRAQNDGLCDYLADYIPSFCQCAQDQTGTQAQITCTVLYFDLTSHREFQII